MMPLNPLVLHSYVHLILLVDVLYLHPFTHSINPVADGTDPEDDRIGHRSSSNT